MAFCLWLGSSDLTMIPCWTSLWRRSAKILDAIPSWDSVTKVGAVSKKIQLIEATNPRWEDLAADWQNQFEPTADAEEKEIPHSA